MILAVSFNNIKKPADAIGRHQLTLRKKEKTATYQQQQQKSNSKKLAHVQQKLKNVNETEKVKTGAIPDAAAHPSKGKGCKIYIGPRRIEIPL